MLGLAAKREITDCGLIERFSFECEKVIGFAFSFGFHAT